MGARHVGESDPSNCLGNENMEVDSERVVTFTVQCRTRYSWLWNSGIFKFIFPLLASA